MKVELQDIFKESIERESSLDNIFATQIGGWGTDRAIMTAETRT